MSASPDHASAPAPVTVGPPGGSVLEIRDFSVVYRTAGGDVRAVDEVNLDLHAGEVVGLAGESGSGKSTLVYGACRLLRPPALITGGSVRYRGRRVTEPGSTCCGWDRTSCANCAGARSRSFSRAP